MIRRITLKLLEIYYGHMADRAHLSYLRLRSKLREVQEELGTYADDLSPERKEALREELDRMMDEPATDLNTILDQVIEEEEGRSKRFLN